jgi:hypothetical protein
MDMRGEGVNDRQEFLDFNILGSVSYPHGWMNRYNEF